MEDEPRLSRPHSAVLPNPFVSPCANVHLGFIYWFKDGLWTRWSSLNRSFQGFRWRDKSPLESISRCCSGVTCVQLRAVRGENFIIITHVGDHVVGSVFRFDFNLRQPNFSPSFQLPIILRSCAFSPLSFIYSTCIYTDCIIAFT